MMGHSAPMRQPYVPGRGVQGNSGATSAAGPRTSAPPWGSSQDRVGLRKALGMTKPDIYQFIARQKLQRSPPSVFKKAPIVLSTA